MANSLSPDILKEEVKALVAKIAEVDPAEVTDEADFVEDLGMDSMMALEILSLLEKQYNLKISESNLTKMSNLKQVLELLNKLVIS